MSMDVEDARRAIAAHPAWYHTIDLAPGVATPGFCDLRPLALRALPGSLVGLRCLDVGTFDGFWAFELERRGAADIVAIDLEDGTQADWPPNTREENLAATAASGLEWGAGFRIAASVLGSAVRRVTTNVYDLDVAMLGGPVDVVLCGTILQHLRDPVGALERMRSVLVPGGELRMVETYSVALSRRHPRRPVGEFRPAVPGSKFTWWVPNLAALRGWATTAGFAYDSSVRPARHRPLRGAGRGDHVVALRFTAPCPAAG
jgi:tRNA (mo5U34)-methyltransferase